MKFEVSRKTWLRGEGSDESFLLRPSDEKMCCLGFRALAAGFTREQILDRKSPDDLNDKEITPGWEKYIRGGYSGGFLNSHQACSLMVTNDSTEYSEADREAKLAELFKEIGDEVTFGD